MKVVSTPNKSFVTYVVLVRKAPVATEKHNQGALCAFQLNTETELFFIPEQADVQ